MEHNVYVISAGRSHDLPFTEQEKALFYFCVPAGQLEEYKAAGCKRVNETGTLIQSRNWALEHAAAEGKICFQVSDDLISIKINTNFYPKQELKLSDIIQEYAQFLNDIPQVNLVGIAPTANSFYSQNLIEKNRFVIGDFFGVKPTPIRFDTALTLKEDYDFTLQHYRHAGIILRWEKYLFHFKHYDNKGGAVDYRTSLEEKKNISYLLEKWPKYLKLNSKRPNEILLKIK
jgi:hypothetical protein